MPFLTKMAVKPLALLFTILPHLVSSRSNVVKYVRPTGSAANTSSCPDDFSQCLTLNDYVGELDQHFDSNITFIFLHGTHKLDTALRVENLQNISLLGESNDAVTVSLGPLASLTWTNCDYVEIDSLFFSVMSNFEYGLVFINSFGIQISSTSLVGSEAIGCSALAFQSSTVHISDSQFIGLSGQLGAAMFASQSSVSFSGNNTLVSNTARLGGAIYSVDSTVIFLGTNHFTNNHATMWNTDLLGQCSYYSVQTVSSPNLISGFGGAIFSDNSSLIVDDSFSFVNNSAEASGGAIAVINNSTLTLQTTDVALVHNISTSLSSSFLRNKITPDSNFQDYISYYSSYGSGGGIYAEDSKVDLTGTSFLNNFSPGSGGALHFNCSEVTIHNVTMVNNSAFIAGAIRVDNKAYVEIYGCNYFRGNSVSESGGVIYVSNVSTVTFNGMNYFNKNTGQRGGGIYAFNASANLEGTNIFDGNSAGRGSAVYLNGARATFKSKNFFRHNSGERGSAIYMFGASISFNGTNHFEDNCAGRGGAFYLSDSDVSFYGSTYFYRNSARSRGGALFIALTTVVFSGPGENLFEDNSANRGGAVYLSEGNIILSDESSTTSFSRNTAESLGGTVVSYDGYLQLRGNVSFNGNKAEFGGALALYGTSRLMLNPLLWTSFRDNQAKYDGGAIFFADSVSSSQCINVVPIECFISIGSDTLSDILITFTNNSARTSGNSLYGGQLDSCRLYFGNNLSTNSSTCQNRIGYNFSNSPLDVLKNISTISMSDISSAPVKICVCKDDSVHNCKSDNIQISIKPGQQFQLLLASFGQGQHVVNSTVLSKNVDFNNNYRLSPTIQLTGKSCTQVTYRLFASDTNIQARYELYFDGPCQSLSQGLDLYIDILPCPVGFKLLGEECVCEERLKNFTQSCFIDNSSIQRVANTFWVSQQTNDSGPINGIVLHQGGCPFDYCMNTAVNVTLDNPNIQCDHNRSGILCGACKENFSLALGSLHCLPCSDAYLALIIPFALAGIALVVILFLLRLTVAAGTINGLIFYANIVQANQQAFFPVDKISFFTVYIAWLNLDLGIETCFYEGMDIYAYSWLQFLFPFYVWLLIGIIVIASHYSQKIASCLGQNPVAVLATLFLMSYSKILTAIITPLAATSLKHTIPNESFSRVWLYDGNIPYFHDPGHVVLGIFTIFTLLFLFLPFTFLLICGHWLQAKSHWQILSWINKIKPFMDAYHAPYKKQTRYWTGLLLLTRCGLFLTFAFNSVGRSRVNLLAISSVCTALAVLKERVYEKHYNDILESSFILNLCILSIATLFITEEGLGSQFVLSSISAGIAFVTLVGIVIFHTYLQLNKTALWGKVKTYVRNSHVFGKPALEDKISMNEVVELKNLERKTTELSIEESLNTSTMVVLREPLLESATY